MKLRLLQTICTLLAFVTCIFTSCNKDIAENTLEVSPASVTFVSSGNSDVTLIINTDADKWTFAKSSWITAEMSGNELTVNCEDNTSEHSREGWIKISAGTAAPVTVSVTQEGTSGAAIEGEAVTIASVSGTTELTLTNEETVTLEIKATLPHPASEEVSVKLVTDPEYLDTFNENDVYYIRKAVLLPSDKATLPEDCMITIPAGRSESDIVTITVDASGFAYDERHLLPLHLEAVKNASVSDEGRANFVLSKPKPIKNIVCFEVNETNPLNALEYKLEDGAMFFDAVVLFSANIISTNGVSLYNNANVQALLDAKDTYLKPLRDAGIKVYLGLLGHHTPAGLAGLTDKGAKQFAEEVAEACYIYGLDGVFLDDEYTSYESNPTGEWYAPRSAERGARLCYELKRAMKEKCPWQTDVSIFVFGSFSGNEIPAVVDNGVTYNQSWFIDSLLPAYGIASYAFGDLTRAQCAFDAFELNKGNAPKASVNTAVEDGFGYCMWFAFHPSDKGNINNNRVRSLGYFRTVSQAVYGQNVLDPKYCYDKLGEGSYDPNPHAL